MIFHVTLEQAVDGWFMVECPALPGCVSQGRNEEEALENIKEAITAWLWAEDQKALAAQGGCSSVTNRIVGSWEMPKSIPLQFLSFAKAYLDSAAQLFDRLCETPQESSFSRGFVVLFLVFHAIELFLKGAILTRSENEKLHHIIKDLKQRYDNLFPESDFSWNIPFNTEYPGLDPQLIKQQKNQNNGIDHHQLYLYPTKKNLEEWKGLFAVEPIYFASDIKAVAADFSRLEPIIFTANKALYNLTITLGD